MADKLFSDLELKNNPSMNGFDLSQRVDFTAKAGELLPIFHRTCMWRDAFKFQVDHFTRGRELVTASRTKVNEYFDWFFVPYRLLYKNSNQVLTNNTKNPISATSAVSNLQVGERMPYITKTQLHTAICGGVNLRGRVNEHGYSRTALAFKLLNHLGFPYMTATDIKLAETGNPQYLATRWKSLPSEISLLPLLAYQCIYYNFFRNTQWEDNVPYNYNMDYAGADAYWNAPGNDTGQNEAYYANPTMFDLRYSNYPRDLFFGILPDSQFGDEAVVDVGEIAISQDPNIVDSDGNPLLLNSDGTLSNTSGEAIVGAISSDVGSVIDELHHNFTILDLRKAQFLQRAREIRGSGRQDYRSLVERVFGAHVSDKDAMLPIYLGGKSFGINTQEIDNTNLVDSKVSVGGKATGSGASGVFELHPDEPGILMCIYHCQPVIDYSLTAVHFDLTKTRYDDFANPLYDRLGYQELPSFYLSTEISNTYVDGNTGEFKNNILGWTSRYFDYKTSIDQTLGDLRETDTNWIAPLNFDYLSDYVQDNQLQINANFFKVRPSILDPLFGYSVDPSLNSDASYVITDQYKVFCRFIVNAVRPLDYRGMPY